VLSIQKIRRLPYEQRFNFALKQKDFIKEVDLLFGDYPDFDHSLLQKKLMDHCDFKQLIQCFHMKNIDATFLTENISEKLPNFISNSYYFYCIDKDLLVALIKIRKHPEFQKLVFLIINSLLKMYADNKKEEEIILILKSYCRTFGYIDNFIDEVAKALLPDIGNEAIMDFVKKLRFEIKDEHIREQILDAITIQDIIT
jgi:hypothetical protein